jgi:hypothetical protein
MLPARLSSSAKASAHVYAFDTSAWQWYCAWQEYAAANRLYRHSNLHERETRYAILKQYQRDREHPWARGDQIDAYLARPTGPGPHPGVVIIHHMPGWDEATKEIARKFAHHGYVAISPNLHFREGKGTSEENSASIRAAGGMPDERTMGDVEGAISYLRTLPYLSGKVGIIGYCSGGRQVT